MMKQTGKVYVVGIGPGSYEQMTIKAARTLELSDIIVGYTVYVDLIREYFPGKELFSTPMMQEVDRCRKALEFAAEAWQKEHGAKNPENTKNAKNAENIPNAKNTDVEEQEHIFMQTNAIVWQMIEGRRQGEDVGKLAYVFHQLLAKEICVACENVRTQKKCNQVALSGGVFQNRLLLELVEKELLNRKFQVLRHHLIPPNDGGIGLGQAVYGMAYLNKKKQTDSKNVK